MVRKRACEAQGPGKVVMVSGLGGSGWKRPSWWQ